MGEFSFESNQSVYVVSDDDIEAIGTPIAIAALGVLTGFGSLCCGILLILVGIILVFTLKDEAVQPMVMNQDGQFVIQQNTASTTQVTQVVTDETVIEPYSFPSTGDGETESKEE